MNTLLRIIFLAFSSVLAILLSSCGQTFDHINRTHDHSVTINTYPENYQVVFGGNNIGETPLTLERKFFMDLNLNRAQRFSLRHYVVPSIKGPFIDTKDGRQYFSFINAKGEDMQNNISFIISEKKGSVLTVVFSSDKSVVKDMKLTEPYTIIEK